jgi:hypothetical protein
LLRYRPAQEVPDDTRLGRLVPDDDEHIRNFPFAVGSPLVVNKTLRLPWWHWSHDQGAEGSCVGHGVVMERAIVNSAQVGQSRRYDPIELWNEAKKVDEWPETNPGDDNGTSVRAAYDVCRDDGICRVKGMKLVDGVPVPVGSSPISRIEGVTTNRWARTSDEMRAAFVAAQPTPVVIGVNWYSNFDAPVNVGAEKWIGRSDLGRIRGGHCVCIYGASDKRQAFRVKNSWGRDYPLVWLPYTVMDRLLAEDGEAALVVDR